MSIRILLADDHAIFMAGLRALLEKDPDLEVIAEVQDGREAVREAIEKSPDLVIMDVSMPGLNGIEATRGITGTLPRTKVLCLSMHSGEQFVTAILEAGAMGYLLKDCLFEELSKAIRVVMEGKTYLSSTITGTVVKSIIARRSQEDPSPFSTLTAREREVLQLLVEGHPTKAIAERLHVSVKTVCTHRENLEAVPDRTIVVGEAQDGREAVRMARELEPDIIIMDIAMPHLNGIEATRSIVSAHPLIRVIGLSAHADGRFVEAMLHAGALGYLLKEHAAEHLFKAILEVSTGSTFVHTGS